MDKSYELCEDPPIYHISDDTLVLIEKGLRDCAETSTVSRETLASQLLFLGFCQDPLTQMPTLLVRVGASDESGVFESLF